MKKPFYLIPIVFGLLALFVIIYNSIETEAIPQQKIPKIEQHVSVLDKNKQSTLEYHWVMENEEALVAGTVKFGECPYNEANTIYKLKTSMDSITSFKYGSKTEIEAQKCLEYNRFIDIRNNLLKLNKPHTCK